MIALLGVMAVLTLLLWLAPGSPEGQLLHRQLVERPLTALARLRRHHLIFVAIFASFMVGGPHVVAVFGAEFMAAYALELAIYFDGLLVTYVLSAAALARRGVDRSAALLRTLLRRPQVTRRKRSNRPTAAHDKPASNDDDPAPALMAA